MRCCYAAVGPCRCYGSRVRCVKRYASSACEYAIGATEPNTSSRSSSVRRRAKVGPSGCPDDHGARRRRSSEAMLFQKTITDGPNVSSSFRGVAWSRRLRGSLPLLPRTRTDTSSSISGPSSAARCSVAEQRKRTGSTRDARRAGIQLASNAERENGYPPTLRHRVGRARRTKRSENAVAEQRAADAECRTE